MLAFCKHSQTENTLTVVTSKKLGAARLFITGGHVNEYVHIYMSTNT